MCLEYELHHRVPPLRSDADALVSFASKAFPNKPIDTRMLHLYLEATGEFPPVCSVMGGMLGNELVKIASLKGDPVQNFMFYDIFDGKGIMHLIESDTA